MSEITQENLIRFFQSHDKPCYVCSGNDWQVTPVNQPLVNAMLSVDGSYHIPPQAVLTFAIICQQCGYARHHEADFVKKWIISQDES